ncbi:hypothetical protein H4219_000796 [Mycoemilia scoparia]|uniref:DUF605-domain-containing protein n=1 Tax=Mycoemilia scoparia TaxID=417184 RepID=A0A9W8DWV7_9FUNG|nr:hypothetical protein H4219_000796 [Mycoemilia scoparia]
MSQPIPPKLNSIKPYLLRAKEIYDREPVIAYFCKYYATKLAIQGDNKDEEVLQFISSLLDDVEKTKTTLDGDPKWQEIIKDNNTAATYFENFALKIFARADTEDRDGKATKVTARNFLISSQFLEVMAVFGELEQGSQEKVKYAKWKATDIVKCIKEGRRPNPGPPGDLKAKEKSPANTEAEATQPRRPSAKEIMDWPSPPAQAEKPLSSDDLKDKPMMSQNSPHSQSYVYPSISSSTTLASPAPSISDQPIQFPGIQEPNAHYPRSQTYIPQQQQQPQFQQHGQPSSNTHSYTNEQFPGYPNSNIRNSPSHSGQNIYPSQSQTLPPPHNAPPEPSARITTSNEQASTNFILDSVIAKQAQKHARWAISALEYDDVQTAIDNLEKAISTLKTSRG